MSYLIDSDWLINALNGRPRTVDTLRHLAPYGISVSLITVGEVYEGALGYSNPKLYLSSLRRFIRPFRRVGLSDATMLRFARIRSELRRRGELIPDFDLILAATALHHELILLTDNQRHFQRIPNLRLYKANGTGAEDVSE